MTPNMTTLMEVAFSTAHFIQDTCSRMLGTHIGIYHFPRIPAKTIFNSFEKQDHEHLHVLPTTLAKTQTPSKPPIYVQCFYPQAFIKC